jgi:hypothetical protein
VVPQESELGLGAWLSGRERERRNEGREEGRKGGRKKAEYSSRKPGGWSRVVLFTLEPFS